MKRIGLVQSFVLIIVLMIFLIISVFTIVSYRNSINSAEQQMEREARLLLSSLDWAISPLIEENKISIITRLLENISASRAIQKIDLIDKEKSVVTSTQHNYSESHLISSIIDDIIKNKQLISKGQNKYFFSYGIPVRGRNVLEGDDIQAVLIVTFLKKYYFSISYPFVYSSLLSALFLSIAISLIIFFNIREILFKPISCLMSVVNQVENGNYNPKIDIKGPDEFKQFGKLFSKMLKVIRDYSVSLEGKIQQRTEELEHTIYDLKKAQKLIVKQEKMASLGQLAAGVAHEINNPISFVSANLEIFEGYIKKFGFFFNNKRIERDEIEFILNDSIDLINESLDGTRRISDIVNGLKNYAKEDKQEMVMSSPLNALKSALSLCYNQLKYKCIINKELIELPDVLCSEDQLTQVFINLLINASQSIKEHGVITLRSNFDNNFVKIEIEDNGEGILDSVIDKLFDPFFTTKSEEKGTGLGLSISQGIINNHGGDIQIDSTYGKGAIFKVLLPRGDIK